MTENSSIGTILMVDDHPVFRRGLSQLFSLDNGLKVVGEADSGYDAVGLVTELDPDLVTLDLNMDGMNGLETIRALRDSGYTGRIIMLTVSDQDDDVVEAIRLGVDGYLLKDMDPDDIVESIKQAAVGKMAISPKLTQTLAGALRQPAPHSDQRTLSSLTAREKEIIKLIAKGLSNKLIARELDISDGTVKVHVKHLLKKLNLRSRVEAAVWMVNEDKEV